MNKSHPEHPRAFLLITRKCQAERKYFISLPQKVLFYHRIDFILQIGKHTHELTDSHTHTTYFENNSKRRLYRKLQIINICVCSSLTWTKCSVLCGKCPVLCGKCPILCGKCPILYRNCPGRNHVHEISPGCSDEERTATSRSKKNTVGSWCGCSSGGKQVKFCVKFTTAGTALALIC